MLMFPQERKLVFIRLCLHAALINLFEVSTRKSLEVTILNYALYNTDSLAQGYLMRLAYEVCSLLMLLATSLI